MPHAAGGFPSRFNQGVARHVQGDLAGAARAYESLRRDFGPHPELARLMGVLAAQKGDRARALALLGEALALQPNHPIALDNRGVILKELRRYDAALADFDRALALDPFSPAILNNRAIALLAAERWEAALAAYDAVLARAPDHAGAWNDRGLALKHLGRIDEALASFERACAARPGFADALNNRGIVLKELKRYDEALVAYDLALKLSPDYADASHNRGNALVELDRQEEADACYQRALALKPNDPEIRFSAANWALRMGRFAEGWRLYESRFDRTCVTDRFSRRGLPNRFEEGAPLAGRRLFMFWEQGLGDVLQFCRFARYAADRGALVSAAAPRRLHRLLRTLGEDIVWLDEDEAPDAFDAHLPMMSAPGLFGAEPESWAALTPYLRAEPERVALWRDRLGAGGRKIGVAWRGHLANAAGRDRGYDPALLKILADRPDVRLISLHRREAGDAPPPPEARIETLPDFDQGPDAFLDTAAVMENLDLIVSCDTSIAHLAGALGRPTWLALKHVAEWRWRRERTDTPWYPSVRLFRQPARDDWAGVFQAMADAL
ncbi:Tfp pilus assembly protein PilF [Rhodoblastus acidophilus]|uniref:Tfp pilus assembly protein PilF n=1 Tax=Rhodoblastus acidophilus TaxID=1074 RepID=A0A212R184_RHOAC|nr:tetratricopeptide repeat-containing glycosyltransferase family protein [Rhodoblastus acidophilus]SNB65784.1 Tfp pilus assembly protein PilF [Rhodoblastus acidophilus]